MLLACAEKWTTRFSEGRKALTSAGGRAAQSGPDGARPSVFGAARLAAPAAAAASGERTESHVTPARQQRLALAEPTGRGSAGRLYEWHCPAPPVV